MSENKRQDILRVSGIYYHYSPAFNRGPLPGISRTIGADGGHPAAILIEYE